MEVRISKSNIINNVLSWRLSNTLENTFCIEVLEDALDLSKPEIFNTDQGSQYTSTKFLSILKKRDIRISMDSKGRALDNVFVERLWRTIKYEEGLSEGLPDNEGGSKLLKGLYQLL